MLSVNYAPRVTKRAPLWSGLLLGLMLAPRVAQAHGIIDIVATAAPTAAFEPVSASLLVGASVALGLGGDDDLTALYFRGEVAASLTGPYGTWWQAGVFWRWTLLDRRRLALAAGLVAGLPMTGVRAELLVPLAGAVGFTVSVTPGFALNGDEVRFAVPLMVGVDFGDF